MTVESVIGSVIPASSDGGKLLVLSNGAYGERIGKMAAMLGIDHDVVKFGRLAAPCPFSRVNVAAAPCPQVFLILLLSTATGETEAVDVEAVKATLAKTKYTHVAVIHHETTAGVLNDIQGEQNARRAVPSRACSAERAPTTT